jgi:hypothetical protein
VPRPTVTVLAVGNGQSSATIAPTPGALLLFGCSQREAATQTPDITIGVTGLTGLTWTEVTIGGSNTSTSLFMARVPAGGAGTGTIQYTCTGTPSRPHYVCAEAIGVAIFPSNTHKINVSNNAAPGITLPRAPGPFSTVVAILSALGTSTVPTPASGFTTVGSGSGTTGFQMIRTADASSPAALANWTAGGATASGNQMCVVELQGEEPVFRAQGTGTTSATSDPFTANPGETIGLFVGARKNGSSPANFVITDSTGYDWATNIGSIQGQATDNTADPDTRTTVRKRDAPDPAVSMTFTVTSADAAEISLVVFTVPGRGMLSPANTDDSNNAAGDPSPLLPRGLTAGNIIVGGAYGIGAAAISETAGYLEIFDASIGTARMAVCYHLSPSSTLLDFTSSLTNTWGWAAEWGVPSDLTSVVASDTLDVGVGEARTLKGFLSRADSLSWALADVVRTIPSAFTRTDGLNVGVGEVRTLKGFHARADVLQLAVVDVAALKSILARADAVSAAIGEGRILKAFLSRVDTLLVGTPEGRALKALLARADTVALAVSLEETGLYIDFGQIPKLLSDTLAVGTAESLTLKVLLARADVVAAAMGELATFRFLLVRADALAVGTGEARALKAFLSRVESLAVAVVEPSRIGPSALIESQFEAGDAVALQLDEAKALLSKLQRADNPSVRITEALATGAGWRPGDSAGVGLIEQARVATVQNRADGVGIRLVESAQVVKMDAAGSDHPWWTDVAGVRPGMATAVEPEMGTV